ncbi:hypothetical protein Q7P37_002340 [Cladosporium fusiforme]
MSFQAWLRIRMDLGTPADLFYSYAQYLIDRSATIEETEEEDIFRMVKEEYGNRGLSVKQEDMKSSPDRKVKPEPSVKKEPR